MWKFARFLQAVFQHSDFNGVFYGVFVLQDRKTFKRIICGSASRKVWISVISLFETLHLLPNAYLLVGDLSTAGFHLRGGARGGICPSLGS